MLIIYVHTWISVKKWHFYGLIKKDLKSVSLDKLYICSTKIWFSQLEIAPIFSLNYAPCYHWVKYHFIVLSVWKKITQDPRSYAAHASRRPPPVGWTRTSAPCSLHERPSREESHTPGESCHPSVSSLRRSPNPHRICRAFALAPSVFVHPEILQEEVTTRWAFPLCLPMSRHYFCASRPLPGGGASVVGAVGRIAGSLQLTSSSSCVSLDPHGYHSLTLFLIPSAQDQVTITLTNFHPSKFKGNYILCVLCCIWYLHAYQYIYYF
jgi:hypothetical protein